MLIFSSGTANTEDEPSVGEIKIIHNYVTYYAVYQFISVVGTMADMLHAAQYSTDSLLSLYLHFLF